jgi:hypothetical protein
MNEFTKLKDYKNIKGKMLYTFCFYKITVGEIQLYLAGLLEKVSSIKDSYKRKIANDRVFGLKSYFDLQEQTNTVNSVYLVNEKNSYVGFLLEKPHINVLDNFKIPCSQYFCDDNFKIDYLQKIVSSSELLNVISIDGSVGKIIQIDSVKNKHLEQTSNIDNLISNNKVELIFGTPNSIGQLAKKYPGKQFFSGKLSNDQIWDEIIKMANLKTQVKLNTEVLSQISNDDKIDLFVFGRKNVRECILSYSVKKIFVCPEIYEKYKTNISSEYWNFEVNVVDKINSGDYGDYLIKNFEGVIGIKYY